MKSTRRAFLGGLGGAAIAAAAPRAAKTMAANGPRFFVAALTMLDRSGKFDPALSRDLLAFLRERGVDGALILGTTGEFSSFSVAERKRILEANLRDKGSLEIMAQVATPNVPETLELLHHAAGAGADSALVLPPFYYKRPGVDGLTRFFSQVLEASRIPVLLYHIPQVSAVEISHELLRRMSQYDKLYGIKDSSGKADGLTAFIKEFPKLKIFTGAHTLIEMALKQGGAGAITGNGNVLPGQTAELFRFFRDGKDLAPAQAKLNEAASLLGGYDGIPAMKFALSRLGLRESGCRPPFSEMSAEKKSELAAKLARLKT
ncbi:MAG: dihydrodipicolinate synthase family protein [Acidobacteria bacterium]|nr:dihydrodipicolinate synthase family protein [Acidobacteriota bacterium]